MIVSINVYAYLNAAWSNITSDVQVDSLMAVWGMRSNKPNDRIADTGQLSFALNNATGKYSPDGASALSGWKKGVFVKVVITYSGNDFIRFRGAVDSVRIDAGTQSQRKAYVTVLDWMDYAAKYPLNAPAVEEDKTADYAIGAIVDAMPIAPQATSYAAGVSIYQTIFDAGTVKTRAYSEFSKLVLSEPGYIYLRKNKANGEALIFEAMDSRNGLDSLTTVTDLTHYYLLRTDGTSKITRAGGGSLLLSGADATPVTVTDVFLEMDVEYGNNIVNYYTGSAYPKRIATTSTKLYTLETPLYFNSGESKVFQIQYLDQDSKRVIAALAPDNEGCKTLLHFDGLNQGYIMTDETGRLWNSEAGDVVTVNSPVKFGIGAAYFDGTSSWITTPSSDDFNFGSGDFTVDWWEYRYVTTSGKTTTKRDYSSTYSPFTFGRSNGTNLLVDMSSNGSSLDIANGKSLGSISTTTWVHYAVVRSGNTFYCFKNGVQTDTWTSSLALNTSTAQMSIGNNNGTYNTAIIDEFRVVKGFALYTTAFTPPTTPYSLSGAFYTAYANADKTGTELVNNFTYSANYGATGAIVTLTNTGAVKAWLTSLDIYSYGVESDSPIILTTENSTSYNEFGYQSEDLQQVYQGDILAAQLELERVVEAENQPRTILKSVTMNANRSLALMSAFLNVDVGDLVELVESQTGIDGYYYIQGVEFEVRAKDIIIFKWIVKQAYLLNHGLSAIGCEFRGSTYTDLIEFKYSPLVSKDSVTNRAFSAWVYLDSVSATYDRAIISNYTGTGTPGFAVYLDNHATDRIVSFYKGFASNSGRWTSTANAFNTGAWAHIFVTFDSSSSSNNPVIYVNGVSQTVTETEAPAGAMLSEVGLNLVLGNYNNSAHDASFDGKLKDVRVYDVANSTYTAAQLAAGVYAAGAGGTTYTSGMVFQAFAVRTSEYADYQDLTLTSATKLLDTYLGIVGTATGSPIARYI